jgi:hypothetical protein
LWDEAEPRSNKFFEEVLNSGYRKGSVILKAQGELSVKWPSYCPKAFALIGDPAPTVRSRCIVVDMVRGNARREFVPEIVEGEAGLIAHEIQAVLSEGGSTVTAAPPTWLDTRDREVWASMLGLAVWLGLDKATMTRIENWAAKSVALKANPARRNESHESEEDTITAQYAERAMRDLVAVMAGHRARFSEDVVKAMRELPRSPWGVFRGGLTPDMLASLVSRFGVKPRQTKIKGKNLRGYQGKDVLASALPESV